MRDFRSRAIRGLLAFFHATGSDRYLQGVWGGDLTSPQGNPEIFVVSYEVEFGCVHPLPG